MLRDSVARKDGIKNIMIYVNAVRSGQTPISMDGGAKAKMQVNRFYIVSMTIIKTYSKYIDRKNKKKPVCGPLFRLKATSRLIRRPTFLQTLSVIINMPFLHY